mmetsp:Transcript_4837/g.6267  ORF Transcript_4837/g.6267 Transcript_4837/m.6267 type:complete len:243 (+) Transcript_4837:49-777(+)
MNNILSKAAIRQAPLCRATLLSSQRTTLFAGSQALLLDSLNYQTERKRATSFQNARGFSSVTSSGNPYNPLEWWKNRQSVKEEEKFRERTLNMAKMKNWTLNEMNQELEEALGWKSKIPGVSGTKEVKQAKEIKATVDALINIVGKDATDSDLESLEKIDKLRAASAADITVEDINTLIEQFSSMCIMQRVLKKRLETGCKLPRTSEKLQLVVQNEGPNFLSLKQKQRMKKRYGGQYNRLSS